MNAFQKKVLDECIGDAHTLLYEKNKGLIRVGKVMNALYEKNKELIALYEKNKGLIRVGKVMNGSSVIPCCKFSVKKSIYY